MRWVFLAQFLGKRGINLGLKWQCSRKINVLIYIKQFCVSLNEGKICTIFLGLHCLPDPITEFEINLTCLPSPCFARILCNMQKYFSNHWSIQMFFTSGIGYNILVDVCEDYILFLISADYVLFNFYLKQKQQLPVWSFAENASFISFHGFEISFKQETTYLFRNMKNKLQNLDFKGKFKYNQAVCFIGYSL